jgi:hypothetical protein
MGQNLIRSIEVKSFDSDDNKDVFVELANGKVLQISPVFNVLNVWASRAELEDWNLGGKGNRTFNIDMGGSEKPPEPYDC